MHVRGRIQIRHTPIKRLRGYRQKLHLSALLRIAASRNLSVASFSFADPQVLGKGCALRSNLRSMCGVLSCRGGVWSG